MCSEYVLGPYIEHEKITLTTMRKAVLDCVEKRYKHIAKQMKHKHKGQKSQTIFKMSSLLEFAALINCFVVVAAAGFM